MLKLILNRVKVLIFMLILIFILLFGFLELVFGDLVDVYINFLMFL